MTDYFMRAIRFDAIPAMQPIGFRIMPNYEYLCPKDGLTIILDLTMEHEIPNCQFCGAQLRRVYTDVPFILKGTGWAGKDG